MTDLNWRPHSLVVNENESLSCITCKAVWKQLPTYRCPGIEVFPGRWEQVWPQGLMTKTQLGQAGYQTGKQLPAVAALLHWSDGKDGYLRLYNPADAVPKRQLTDAQRANIDRLRAINIKNWHCSDCGDRLRYYGPAVCERCSDRNEMQYWAEGVIGNPQTIFLDMETTGLDTSSDRPVEIAVIDICGEVLLNTRVRPDDLSLLTEDAIRIHGITHDDLKDAPSFADIHPQLQQVLKGKALIIYNADYDWSMLRSTCKALGLPLPDPESVGCAMEAYSQFYGDWSYYWQDYKWQSLPGGDHSALGDARATLDLIRYMANPKPEKESV